MQAYFEKNYVAAIHILIPQIEEAARNLIELNSLSIYKNTRYGGIMVKTFDEILNDIIMTDVLPIDLCYYLRILYTDPRGWNLRNQFCHGFYPAGLVNYATADRVLHSLLCFAMIRKNG